MIRTELILFAIVLPATFSCARTDPAPDAAGYGEPMHVQMTASGGLPPFEIALAVSSGAPLDSLVAPLAGALHGALKGCDHFVTASQSGGVTQLAFSVEQGKALGAVVSGEHADPCLVAHLDGQAVPLPQPLLTAPPLRVLAQIRFAGAETSGAAEAP